MIVRISGAASMPLELNAHAHSTIHRYRKTSRLRFDLPSHDQSRKIQARRCPQNSAKTGAPDARSGGPKSLPKRMHVPPTPFTVQKPCSALHSSPQSPTIIHEAPTFLTTFLFVHSPSPPSPPASVIATHVRAGVTQASTWREGLKSRLIARPRLASTASVRGEADVRVLCHVVVDRDVRPVRPGSGCRA